MKKFIVCTTINEPTKALEDFAKLKGWKLIVVGDTKTPKDWHIENAQYLSPKMQEKKYKRLSDILGWCSVDRRNLGFLEAYNQGADIVAMVDDDNYPKANWGKNLLVGKKTNVITCECEDIAFDPLSIVGNSVCWHRGFPIELVKRRNLLPDTGYNKKKVLVQADLWDYDPDVDAVCRMLYSPDIEYTHQDFYSSNKFSPFNMQNTFVARDVLKYVISIPFIGRMCDIWGAYYFQSIFPNSTVYGPSTVVHRQDRSWKSIVKDMEEELLGYHSSLALLKDLNTEGPEAIFKHIPEKAKRFIKEYQTYFD